MNTKPASTPATLTDANSHGDKMRRAFALVSPDRYGARHWKDEIVGCASIADMAAEGVTIDDVKASVAYMTATEAKAVPYTGVSGEIVGYAVTAPGYWKGPAC